MLDGPRPPLHCPRLTRLRFRLFLFTWTLSAVVPGSCLAQRPTTLGLLTTLIYTYHIASAYHLVFGLESLHLSSRPSRLSRTCYRRQRMRP